MAEKNTADEIIIVALIECGTVRKAAEKLGLSQRTIYSRLKNREFNSLYSHAKDDLLRGVVSELVSTVSDAINSVSEIMRDKRVNAQTRLQAAQTIISNADRFMTRLSDSESKTRDGSMSAFERTFDF